MNAGFAVYSVGVHVLPIVLLQRDEMKLAEVFPHSAPRLENRAEEVEGAGRYRKGRRSL